MTNWTHDIERRLAFWEDCLPVGSIANSCGYGNPYIVDGSPRVSLDGDTLCAECSPGCWQLLSPRNLANRARHEAAEDYADRYIIVPVHNKRDGKTEKHCLRLEPLNGDELRRILQFWRVDTDPFFTDSDIRAAIISMIKQEQGGSRPYGYVRPSQGCSDVYLMWNERNGKVYVGQSNDAARRMSEHEHYTNIGHSLVDTAIQEEGIENFGWGILASNVPNPDMIERRWIRALNCKAPHGYNLLDGGKDCKPKRLLG